jgi:hypothetical protein
MSEMAMGLGVELMMSFAERTGLTGDGAQQRYLWTDAFAVCNFLGLGRMTGDERYIELALRLVDRVHHTLGRHRSDDERTGWISGLGEQEGESHPTQGCLRIGKKLPERLRGAPFDEVLEWDRDGQYFHYLTKWMHALDQAARATKRARLNGWARELAEVAARAFQVRAPGRAPFLAWKMSIDLTRPLVHSTGQHDPLDGFITCAQLRRTASSFQNSPDGPSLREESAALATMMKDGQWATADPLGIGGLLMDACRVDQLMENEELLRNLLVAALHGLTQYVEQSDLRGPASRRLAFRELGLSIGLHGIDLMNAEGRPFQRGPDVRQLLARLRQFGSLGSAIESFWLDPEHRAVRTWSEHRDINDVTLATCLVPEGTLDLSSRY